MISYLPFAGLGAATSFSVVGQPPQPRGEDFGTDVSVVDNGYFATMRITLKRGRLFTAEEMVEKRDVVIINEALAAQYFPGRDPIGQRVVINMTNPNLPTEIIGIVANSKFSDLRTNARPASYWPHPQLPYTAMTFAIRTAGDPLGFAPAVEAQIPRHRQGSAAVGRPDDGPVDREVAGAGAVHIADPGESLPASPCCSLRSAFTA
jgi:hypothetical protein